MHKKLLANVEKAISDLFSDVSVSKEQTLCDLKMLKDDLEIRIDSLKERIKDA